MARNKLLLRQIYLRTQIVCLFCLFLFLFKHSFTIADQAQKVNNIRVQFL